MPEVCERTREADFLADSTGGISGTAFYKRHREILRQRLVQLHRQSSLAVVTLKLTTIKLTAICQITFHIRKTINTLTYKVFVHKKAKIIIINERSLISEGDDATLSKQAVADYSFG